MMSVAGARRTCISRLPGVRHKRVLVQLSCLIIFGLENGRPSHGSLGCCNNDEVLSGDAQKYLPRYVSERVYAEE